MGLKRVLVLNMAMAAGLAAAGGERPGTTEARQAQQDAASAQRRAVAAMEAALAAQRASIARQAGAGTSGAFFLLPAPSVAPASAAAPPACDPLPASELDPLIADAARREELQPELLRSVAMQESGFRPCAVSPQGAMGLMQLMPATAKDLGVGDPFDPRQNIDAGARLLKTLLTTYGNLPLALGAYNAGPGRVDQAGGLPKIDETLRYVMQILSSLGTGNGNAVPPGRQSGDH